MKFSRYQVIAILASVAAVCSLDVKKIADGVDNIFLRANITVEETKSILTDARESYRTLTDYNNESDPEQKKILLTKLKVFTSQVAGDLVKAEMSLRQFFRNINTYLKDGGNAGNETSNPAAAAPIILRVLDRKIAEHCAKPMPTVPDVKGILSVPGGGLDTVLRGSENLSPTTIGFFFLEAFATIFGLSWGLISMILSDFQ